MQGAPAPSQSDVVDPGPSGQIPDAPPAPAEGSPPSAGSPLFNLMHSHDIQANPSDYQAAAKQTAGGATEASANENPYSNLKNQKAKGEVTEDARVMSTKKVK